MKLKSFIFSVLSFLLPLLVVLLVIEGALRAWYFVHNRLEPPLAYVSESIGWRPTENLTLNYQRKGYGEIDFTSNSQGFRRYGNPQSSKTKVFAVGDSYTHAYHVSDGKAYFDILADLDNSFEVFALGAGGYGTLQQAMILRQYLGTIEPHYVVWQFTGNDFINNDYQLESQSSENSSHMRRPFLEQGEIVSCHPDGLLGAIAEYSYLARRLLVIRGSFIKRSKGSIEDQLDMQHEGLIRSVETTKEIINGVTRDYPDITFFGFFAGGQHYPWEQAAFAELCGIQQFSCLPEINRAVVDAGRAGQQIDGGRDGHWNQNGHHIAGKMMHAALQAEPGSR